MSHELVIEELIEPRTSKGSFDTKKVEKIRKAWSKGQYSPNAELIAYIIFNS